MSGRQIMTAEEIRRATIRISHEIVEKQAGTAGLALVGIQRRGVPLARRIAAAIGENESTAIPVVTSAGICVTSVFESTSTTHTVWPKGNVSQTWLPSGVRTAADG